MDLRKENQPTADKAKSLDANTKPEPTQQIVIRSKPEPTYPRHIEFPYNLHDLQVEIEGDVLNKLLEIFPGATSFAESAGRSFLHFTMKTLPQTPLPLTIGGIPIAVCDDSGNGKGSLCPYSTPGNMSIRICDEITVSRQSFASEAFRKLADAVTRAFLDLLPDLTILEVIVDNDLRFHVVLPDNINIQTTRNHVPGRIARCWTMYLNEKDLCRPAQPQAILPRYQQRQIDDFPYNVLRPGVLITSPRILGGTEVFTTTSGVLVEDQAGNRFMTAASHGIGSHTNVYQKMPLNGRRLIGKAHIELTWTDIALVKLEDGVEFENVSFTQEGHSCPCFKTLFGEDPSDNIDLRDPVYLNSPFTGSMDGVVIHRSWRPYLTPPVVAQERKIVCVMYDWVWTGQNQGSQATIPDSVCGTPVWDSHGRILSFFRYIIQEGPWAGFYAAVKADHLVKAGYTLAK